MRGWGIALVLVATTGCTLLSHEVADLPSCERNADCEPVNARFGIGPEACERYQCEASGAGGCVLGPRDDDGDGDPALACGGTDCDDADPRRRGDHGEERCDGVDEDCDRIVDEGALVPAEGPGAPRTVAAALDGVETMTAARDASGALGLALASGTGAAARGQIRFVRDDTTERTLPLRYRTQEETPGGIGSPFVDYTVPAEEGCYPWPSTCNMRDVVVAEVDPAAERWLLAAVDDRGCRAGRLRLAWLDAADGLAFSMGPPARAAPAFGVDVASQGACTGSRSGAIEGARRPALAALPGVGPRPQGLLSYLAAPRDGVACEGEAAVQAVGLWLTSRPIGGAMVTWVDASDANVPATLGTTAGDGRPAVVAVDGPAGYLVAHGDARGGVALHFVPAVQTVGDDDVDPTCASVPDGCDEPHATPPLEPRALGVLDAGGAMVDRVGLAVAGRDADGRLVVGVTWQLGCEGRGVGFAVVRADPSAAGSLASDAPVELSANGRAPAIVALEDLVLPGFERDGATAEDATGGWLVSWVAEGRVRAQRVLALDGRPVAGVESLTGLDGTPLAAARWRAAASSPRRARFGALEPSGRLVGGTLACAPAE
ncbi:MAG TPA: putative metal-binding motif-containing protein [Sandaracinaceae bacterium LLY-WYZ-13_1]|nr:putative metal-binding motif-containing protein [Sandaracinaceae bacterium LLY-WYZ-13_1]